MSIRLIAERRSKRSESAGSGVFISKVSFPHFFEEVIAGTPRERHNRERGIFVRVGAKRSAIVHEEILHLPSLTPLVRHGFLWVCAHDRPADFVDNLAARFNRGRARGLRFPCLDLLKYF